MASLLQRNGTFKDPDNFRSILLHLNTQRNEGQFCDVILRVCGTEIFAHACVLSAASPYFSSFLGTGSDWPRSFSQKQPQIIEIHIDNLLIGDGDGGYSEAVGKVVEFMYTSSIILTTTLYSQVIEISRIMQLDKLFEYCNAFQKGVNGNLPKSISTCTSTLQDVLKIFAPRSCSRSVDAETETEDEIFKKISTKKKLMSCAYSASVPSSSYSVFDCEPATQNITHSINEHAFQPPMSNNCIIVPIEVNKCQNIENLKLMNNSEACPAPADLESECLEEDFNAIKSFEDIPEYDTISNCRTIMPKPFNNPTPGLMNNERQHPLMSDPVSVNTTTNTESLQHKIYMEETVNSQDKQLPCKKNLNEADMVVDHIPQQPIPQEIKFPLDEKSETESMESVPQQMVTQSELQQFADLVTFQSFYSSIATGDKIPQPTKSRGGGWPRGGRKRKRGRGRPRKETRDSTKADDGSDYEFEKLMEKLEKGQQAPKLEESDEQPENEETMDSNSDNVGKKSRRIKSKPSFFKKDYIFHSVKRRSRKNQSADLKKLDTTKSTPAIKSFIEKLEKNDTNESSNNKTTYVCLKCDFNTSVFRSYEDHLLDVHPELKKKTFSCQKCSFITQTAKAFRRHKEKHMSEDLVCAYCQYQATSIEDDKNHKLLHAGNLPYFCTECDLRFKHRNQLESHKPKHWVKRPFVCPICSAGFKWKHALKNHMITHSTVKDQLCDICGYATGHKSMLKIHRLTHREKTFKCAEEGCKFQSTTAQKLKMHMLRHSSEKPHQCEVCGQQFTLAKNMRRHLLLHSNKRPFACKICSFTTTRYDKLKDHNHKLHNIGKPPVSKKSIGAENEVKPTKEVQTPEATAMNPPTTAFVPTEIITINPDGTITPECIQRLANLAAVATASQGSTHIDVSQIKSDEIVLNIAHSGDSTQIVSVDTNNTFPIFDHYQLTATHERQGIKVEGLKEKIISNPENV